MLIAVCVKQVPDRPQVETDPQTHTLRRTGAGRMLNPFDLHALEEALRLKQRLQESGAEVQTLALSMGPAQAREALREALSIGIDRALLLCDAAFAGGDTWATARVLCAAIRHCGAGLVLCGKQAVDGDTAQVGPELAALLGWPQICYVTRVHEISPASAMVERRLDDCWEIIRVTLPAVLTVLREINAPRLPTLPGVLRARAASIPELNAQTLGLDRQETGLSGSLTQVRAVRVPDYTKHTRMLDAGDPVAVSRELAGLLQTALHKKT